MKLKDKKRMGMKKIIVLTGILCVFFSISFGQPPTDEGDSSHSIQRVNFIEGLSWDEIKTKAKRENKHIFLDVFATWCGPCKQMDKKTYTDAQVIKFLNEKFISVKVQTDQTQNDPETVKKWYADAKTISEQYNIISLPTYIFLFPDGLLAYKDGGFKLPANFIEVCEKAIAANQVYVDPNKEFYLKSTAYKNGNKDTSDLIGFRNKAIKLRDRQLVQLINKDLLAQLKNFPEEKLLTKDYLQFIADYPLQSSSPFFKLFFPNAAKANAIIGQEGFAERIVNNTILQEKVMPFLKANGFTNPWVSAYTRVYLGSITKSVTPDWKQLRQSIKKDFGQYYAERNTLEAMVHWYISKRDFVTGYRIYFKILNKYGMDTVDKSSTLYPGAINGNCWFIFENISDRKILNLSVKWMKETVKFEKSYGKQQGYSWLDTYANLLHKKGRTKQAIAVEKRAIEIARAHPEWLYTKEEAEKMEVVVKKMEQGLPTWPIKLPFH